MSVVGSVAPMARELRETTYRHIARLSWSLTPPGG
jgi:hypothetical protein